MRCVRVTIVAVMLSVSMYIKLSRMQCACTVLYCHLWSVLLYHIFPRNLKKGTTVGKKISLLNIKRAFLGVKAAGA